MRIHPLRAVIIAAVASIHAFALNAYAWHDRTHLAIAEAAGFDLWYSAAAPDVVKSKASFTPIESPNHYFNNKEGRRVTAEMVLGQVDRYDRLDETGEGHLYGAIIGSVRAYRSVKATGKYARYPLAYCAHYVGDLSMPLHNTPYDVFNKTRHSSNDGVINAGVMDRVGVIRRRMKVPIIRSEADLARQIAGVAESARKLGLKMRREDRDMTAEEAYIQVICSASLLNAVLAYAEMPAEPAAENKP